MPNENKADSPTPNPLLMEEIPQTLDQLMDRIGKLFHCMTGPPLAYFDAPLVDLGYDDLQRHDYPVARFEYVTLRWSTSDTAGAEARLVMAMLEPFIDVYRRLVPDPREVYKPILFWRNTPAMTIELDPESTGHLIRCRVCIPGARMVEWVTPPGVPSRRL